MKITGVSTTLLRAATQSGPRDLAGEDLARSIAANDMSIAHAGALDLTYPVRWRMKVRLPHQDVAVCLVRVSTDEGIEGVGQAGGMILPAVAKPLIDDYLGDIVIGQDPFLTRRLWDRLRAGLRAAGHIQGFYQNAVAGIDMALWDIKGKAIGRPVCDLLGGRYRDRVRVYFTAVLGLSDEASDDQRQRLALAAEGVQAAGFTGLKIVGGYGLAADLESVKVVRQVLGERFLIALEGMGCYDYLQSLRLARGLAEHGVEWFEGPLPTEDLSGYIELSKASPIPIGNDVVWTLALYREMLSRGARLIVQPDVVCIGITECAQIFELADVYGCAYAPHLMAGPVVEAATMHLAAAAPNFLICEYRGPDNPMGNGLLRSPLEFSGSAVTVPTGPGLGIELDEDMIERHIL